MNLTRRAALGTLGAAALGGCAPRAMVVLAPAPAGGAVRPVFVGTTRALDAAGLPGEGRSEVLRFGRFAVSVPPAHRPGVIELPGRGAATDPARHFAMASAGLYPGAAAFRAALGRALAAEPGGRREAVVFVHGFNSTFAEGTYRIAQIAHDLQAPAVAVHYAWPSAAHPLGYAHDRDSALFARDGLAALLVQARAAGARTVTLVAHSMGALLAMEALRQIAIADAGAVRRLVDAVILFSPDIDVELFHIQARRIGRLPEPFVIFTSRRDRALALSARLTGRGGARLGNLREYAPVADLDVTLLDVSAFRSAGFDHFALARSPTLLRLFSRVEDIDAAFGADQSGRTGLLPGTVLTLQNATAIILSPVTGEIP